MFKKSFYRRCKALHKRLKKEGGLTLVQGSEHRGMFEAQPTLGVHFTIITTGRRVAPAYSMRFFSTSANKECTFFGDPRQEPRSPDLDTVGQHQRVQQELFNLLDRLGV